MIAAIPLGRAVHFDALRKSVANELELRARQVRYGKGAQRAAFLRHQDRVPERHRSDVARWNRSEY